MSYCLQCPIFFINIDSGTTSCVYIHDVEQSNGKYGHLYRRYASVSKKKLITFFFVSAQLYPRLSFLRCFCLSCLSQRVKVSAKNKTRFSKYLHRFNQLYSENCKRGKKKKQKLTVTTEAEWSCYGVESIQT